jgi:hypothetical protein
MLMSIFSCLYRYDSGPYPTKNESDEALKCWTRKRFGEASSLDSKICLLFAKVVCGLEIGLRNLFELISPGDFTSGGPSINILKCEDCSKFWSELSQK